MSRVRSALEACKTRMNSAKQTAAGGSECIGAARGEQGPPRRSLLFVVVDVIATVLSLPADPGVDVHGQKLTTFDEFRIRAYFVNLNVEEKPAFTEDLLRINNARGLFVV